jgi:hypothetical protein
MEKPFWGNGRRMEAWWRSEMTRTFFFLLILLTLLDSFNFLEWREEEVLAVAAVAALFFVMLMKKSLLISNLREIVIVVLFSSLVIAQQYFVTDGSFVFGIKYALVLLATFIPYWIARTLGGNRTPGLERTVVNAIGLVFLVTTITVFASYFFGEGEVYIQPSGFTRAFGWLGDSFPPVIVFFVFYYFFRKKYLIAGLSMMVLLMTVAKSAFLMLFLSPLVFVFGAARLRTKIALAGFYLALLLSLMMFTAPIFEKMSDLFQADYSYNTRLLSIYSGLDYFFRAPLTGIGINQSLVSIEADAREYADRLGVKVYFDVHQIDNSIIKTAAETGVLGLALLLLLFYVLLSSAFRTLQAGRQIANARARAIVLASSLWVIGFILFYQTTGWFEAGHPQLCWLLLFATLADVFCRRHMTGHIRFR